MRSLLRRSRILRPRVSVRIPGQLLLCRSLTTKTPDELLERTTSLLNDGVNDTQTISLLKEWLDKDSTNAAAQMESILQSWLKFNNQYPKTIEPFQLLISKHHDNKNGDAAAEVLSLWGDMLSGNLQLTPPLSAFHSVLEAYGSSDVAACVEIITVLEKAHWNGQYALAPKVETYSHLFHAVNNGQYSEGDLKGFTSDTIDSLQDAYDAEPKTPATSYHMIRAFSNVLAWGAKTKKRETLTWLNHFQRYFEQKDCLPLAMELASPNEPIVSLISNAFQAGLDFLASVEPTASHGQVTLNLLVSLEGLNFSELPAVSHFEAAANCWADKALIPHKADEVLDTLLMHYEERFLDSDPESKISFRMYERVIWLLGHAHKAEKAESLLKHFMRLKEQRGMIGDMEYAIVHAWNSVLLSYFAYNNPDRTFALWEEMRDSNVKMNETSYGAALKALSRLKGPTTTMKAMKVWEMLAKDHNVNLLATHYGSFISTFARHPSVQSAKYAMDILDTLESEYAALSPGPKKQEMMPQQAHYTAVMTALTRSGDPEGASKARRVFERLKSFYNPPDRFAYTTLINALAKEQHPKAAENAEELLDQMGSQLGFTDVAQGDVVAYTAIMTAWARSARPGAIYRVEELLRDLERLCEQSRDQTVKPDSRTYGVLIMAWAKTRRPDAGSMAEKHLRSIQQLEKESGRQLATAFHYSNVILAHGKSGAPTATYQVERLLNEMKEMAANGNTQVAPEVVAYSGVMNCWARSKARDKAPRTWQILQEMNEEYRRGNLSLRPNVFCYTAVLTAAAHTRGDPEHHRNALKIALEAMQEFRLQPYYESSPPMFLALLKVFRCNVADAEERTRYSSTTFKQCCQEGQVDDSILWALRDFEPGLYEKLPRDMQNEIKLPPEWSMNLRRRRS